MLTERELRAIRHHAKQIEDFEAARKLEFHQIIGPVLDRVQALWRSLNEERLQDPDAFASFVACAETIGTSPNIVSEFSTYVEPVRTGIALFDLNNKPKIRPYDTPNKLITHITYNLNMLGRIMPQLFAYTMTGQMVLAEGKYKHRPGQDPDFPPDDVRILYQAARERALKFARLIRDSGVVISAGYPRR